MKKFFKNVAAWGFEGPILVVFIVLFVAVLGTAWEQAMKLRETIAGNAQTMNVDPSGMIEIERIRALSESKIADARAYFVMGSKSIFDKQKEEMQSLTEALATYEKNHGLPQVSAIVKKIEAITAQEHEAFDQGMEFRDKQTESKIVGQFYQAKTAPLVTQLNQRFAELAKIESAQLDEARNRARNAGLEAQSQIPKAMKTLMSTLGLLFLGVSLLVVRMIRLRQSHLKERERLVREAKDAILSRDEVISAASEDFKEPLQALSEIATTLKSDNGVSPNVDIAGLIENTVQEMRTHVDNIYDQKRADLSGLTLRLDQLAVSSILDEAQVILSPLAKQRDVTLQFDPVNASVLAYVDRERVLRVLSSLIGNAIKFSPKHSRVAVKVKSDAQFVNFSVIDNGSGIPEAQRSEIFGSFWQARKTASQGAGVGLAVVKTIIEAHGGTVVANASNIGPGTTITFSLPRRRPAGALLKKPASPGVRHIARTTPPPEITDRPTH